MINQDKVIDIFSIFHDGTIVGWDGDRDQLKIRILCSYLAERINAAYEFFDVVLEKIERLALIPWMNPPTLEQEYFVEIEDVFEADLDILGAENDEDLVKVSCNQCYAEFDYCGGYLYLACKDIKVFDQSGVEISTERLALVCKQYWDDFAKK